MKPHRNITARPSYVRPLAPIKLERVRIRSFRPDSSTNFQSRERIGRTDFDVFITLARIDALPTLPEFAK